MHLPISDPPTWRWSVLAQSIAGARRHKVFALVAGPARPHTARGYGRMTSDAFFLHLWAACTNVGHKVKSIITLTNCDHNITSKSTQVVIDGKSNALSPQHFILENTSAR